MPIEAVLDQLRSGQPYTEVAQGYMQSKKDEDRLVFLVDLVQLMVTLHGQEGPWRIAPEAEWNIDAELLSAFSKAWKESRPVNKGWREELNGVILILSGKYRRISSRELSERLDPKLVNVLDAFH